MVIEERDLVFPPQTPRQAAAIYDAVLQRPAPAPPLGEALSWPTVASHDLWLSLQATFRLFEADGAGRQAGHGAAGRRSLWPRRPLARLDDCTLGNDVLLGCLRSLGLYRNPDTRQMIRVNYAALNVEEFGSVYEGLLKFEPGF